MANNGLLGDQTQQEYYSGETGVYRYISLDDIVRNFIVANVGDGKLISKAKRSDVVFHAKRGIQEFSYDISKVEKIYEVELGPSLNIPMPQDYVNYVAFSWVDMAGIEHPIGNGRLTSNPTKSILQDSDYGYLYDNDGDLLIGDSITTSRFSNLDYTSINGDQFDDVHVNSKADSGDLSSQGIRYGIEPELTNSNGVFIINENEGTISFSSDLAYKIITIKYISDGVGTDSEMKVHKLAEEAIYKHIALALLSSAANVPEYIINRFKKEKRATLRNAKLRLYNLKMSEMTNVMRGKSKQIKH